MMKTVNGTTIIEPKLFGARRFARVIVDGVTINTNIRKIREGFSPDKETNDAVRSVLGALEYINGYKKRCGIARTWNGKCVQIDVI